MTEPAFASYYDGYAHQQDPHPGVEDWSVCDHDITQHAVKKYDSLEQAVDAGYDACPTCWGKSDD
jgi:hypothetical protein